ncbi:MAG: hypothetical protein ACFCU8_19595 [Thermosynechococcaceae cyanobacterium]
MSESRQFSRQVLNGKVVYVPQPGAIAKLSSKRPAPKRLSLTLGPWLAAITILGMGSTVAALAWLGWEAIINPDVAFWMNRFLPTAVTTPSSNQPRTLAQIQQRLRTPDQRPGEPIVLTADFNFNSSLQAANDLLIPVSRQSCAGQPCQQLTDLYIYRSLQLPYPLRLFQGERYYHQLDRLTVEGPTESDLIKLVQHSDLVARSHPLPLTTLQPYEPAPHPGVWLKMSGLKTIGSATSAYGQILYFHPNEGRLGLLLNWASPAGAFPVWQQVIAGGQPELFIDQSVGLEPQFGVYQTLPADNGGLQLRPILLNQPAFKHPVYSQGLALARSGLWKPAQNLLLTVKKNQPQRWSAPAQAQLTLIDLHAKVTEARAREAASNPIQSIVAYTINGDWGKAIAVFEDKKTRPDEVQAMLGSDSGRLMERVEATLAVQPHQKDAIAWGAMVIHVQEGPAAAFAWTRQKTAAHSSTLKKVQQLLQRLEKPAPQPASPFDAAQKKSKALPTPAPQPAPVKQVNDGPSGGAAAAD